MSKSFWGIVVAIVIALVGLSVLTSDKSEAPSSGGNSSSLTSHVQGKGTSGVTLLEYGDFQCAYCQQYHATIEQVQADYGDKLKFQFRNFPIVSIHKNAFAASRAAEAADLQGKFWEMHDLLYETNDPNGASGWVAAKDAMPFFEQYAKKIGLDMTKFKKDFASGVVNDRINADLAEGNKLGITGTPTFYLNGKKIEVNNDVASFKKVIDAEIAKQKPASNSSAQQ